VINLRIPIKTEFGNEVILSEEDWMTLCEMNFKPMATMDEISFNFPIIYYIEEGVAEFTIGDDTIQWGYGKSIKINPNVSHTITAMSPLRIIKVAKCKMNIEKKLV
jgi:quercetin dioxygenase-like cupin family protein